MSARPSGPRRVAPASTSASSELDRLRREIDRLDQQLLTLLNARATCALRIGELKHRLGLEIHQPKREMEVLRNVRTANTGPLGAEAITRLFERIIDEARR